MFDNFLPLCVNNSSNAIAENCHNREYKIVTTFCGAKHWFAEQENYNKRVKMMHVNLIEFVEETLNTHNWIDKKVVQPKKLIKTRTIIKSANTRTNLMAFNS